MLSALATGTRRATRGVLRLLNLDLAAVEKLAYNASAAAIISCNEEARKILSGEGDSEDWTVSLEHDPQLLDVVHNGSKEEYFEDDAALHGRPDRLATVAYGPSGMPIDIAWDASPLPGPTPLGPSAPPASSVSATSSSSHVCSGHGRSTPHASSQGIHTCASAPVPSSSGFIHQDLIIPGLDLPPSPQAPSQSRRTSVSPGRAEARQRLRLNQSPEDRKASQERLLEQAKPVREAREKHTKNNRRRNAKRVKKRDENSGPAGFKLNTHFIKNHPGLEALTKDIAVTIDDVAYTFNAEDDLSHTKIAHTAVPLQYTLKPGDTNAPPIRNKIWTKDELIDQYNYRYYPWDGRTTTLFLDEEDRIVVTCVGRPSPSTSAAPNTSPSLRPPSPPASTGSADQEQMPPRPSSSCSVLSDLTELEDEGDFWDTDVCQPAYEELAKAGAELGVGVKHNRGTFCALASGISFGNGQQRPGNLVHTTKAQARVAARLQASSAFKRIANFASSAFAAYMPKGYIWVEDIVQANIEHYANDGRTLLRPYAGSVWPACTWNMPPKSCACDHRDAGNAPCIPCSITALGPFDPDRSAALILFDLQLIIRFPPGSTVLICSGGMRHGNTAIHPDDKRGSFIQYCAGGLERHIEYNFIAGEAVPQEEIERVARGSEERWQDALQLFSTPDSLDADRALFQQRNMDI